MNSKNGTLSIDSANMFTILKNRLYTDSGIVIRELVSNAQDAVEKFRQIGHDPSFSGEIKVVLDPEAKTLNIRDNGVGMSFEEVDKYINQIAFSGAEEFTKSKGGSIIGQFGLGFYSAFILASHVTIDTKSCNPDCPAVRWDCLENMSYSMGESERESLGTDVVLSLDPKNPFFDNPKLVQDLIGKFFAFAKTPIQFIAPGFEGTVTGGTEPEWLKAGNKESLENFYKSFFADPQGYVFEHAFESKDIGVRGVIFFRKINDGEAEIDGHIKVYCRGVYVGDNIPGLVPKLAALENGIIECESLPLLAARSGLALGDAKSEAVLISECISQELAIFFHDLFSNRRAELEAAWPDVGAFVKYGVLQDKIFSSVMARKILFMDSFGQCKTVAEHAANGGSAVYYASDMQEQAYYIDIFKQANAGCLLFDHVIDRPLLYKYETLFPKLKFSRIDSNLELVLGAEPLPEDERDAALLEEKMLALLGDRLKELKPVAKRLKSSHIAAVVTNDEESRRLADLMDMYGYLNPDDSDQKERVSKSKLLLNVSSKPVRHILKAESESAAKTAATHLLDMALLGQNALKPEYVPAFIQRSVKMLELFLDDGAESES